MELADQKSEIFQKRDRDQEKEKEEDRVGERA